MTLKQFEYVQTLSKTLNFTLAAEELGITQPSLSQYIKKIEKKLGTDLFIRNGQDIRLTDAGHIFLEAGRRMLDIEHRMQASFLDLMENKTGTLVIGSSPYRSASMMPTVVAEFRRRYPGVQVVIEEGTTAELIAGAEHGRFDLCVLMRPVNEHIFSCENIRSEELILAVPSSYKTLPAEKLPDRKHPAIDIGEIEGQDFVMVTRSQVMQRELNNLCADYRIRLNEAVTVKSLEAQLAMVRAGVGMALLPSGIECFCAPNEVSFYSFRQELPRREVVAIWPKDRLITETARCLLNLMKK